MNERFYLLPDEKQNTILNAAYKVFALNEYKKAPMSEIAYEGNISKSLLFHYFHNKLELYLYLWKQAKILTANAMLEFEVYETDDFFVMLKRGLRAKCDLMRRFPYIYLFSMNAYYETFPDVKTAVQDESAEAVKKSFEIVRERIDRSRLRSDLEFEEIYQEIVSSSDGFLIEKYRSGNLDIESFERDYLKRIELWEKAYGKNSYGRENISDR